MSVMPKIQGGLTGRITLMDIADQAGVSKSTVSLVLRRSPLVRAETRERVLAIIGELGYVYHRGAAALRSQRTQTVGLVINDVTNPFYSEFTASLDAALEREGWVAFFGNSGESPARQQMIIDRMREQGVEGIVLCPARETSPEVVDRLRASGLPCVQATRYVTDRNTDYVGQDNVLGMEMAIDHLVRLGHRRIAFIGGSKWNSSAVEREMGYRNALERHGIEYDRSLIFPCETRPEVALSMVSQVLASALHPTAAVCINDFVAFGVMKGLNDHGMEPGRDFAVIGFDNRRDTALWRPALTTVSILAESVAQETANLLLRRIEDPAGESEWIVIPPRELVIRDSCGAWMSREKESVGMEALG